MGHSHHASLSGIGGPSQFDYRGMSTAVGNHGQPHGLPRLDTHLGFGSMGGGGLRTAPIQGAPGPDDLELEKFFGASSGSTINPNQLHHFNGNLAHPQSPFRQFANPFAGNNPIEEDDFAWNTGMDNSMMFSNENAIEGSSPSAISTASQGAFNEVMLDGSGQPTSAAMCLAMIFGRSIGICTRGLASNLNVTAGNLCDELKRRLLQIPRLNCLGINSSPGLRRFSEVP